MLKKLRVTRRLSDSRIAGGSAKVEHYEGSYCAPLELEAMGQSAVLKLLQKNPAQEEQTANQNRSKYAETAEQQAMSGAAPSASKAVITKNPPRQKTA